MASYTATDLQNAQLYANQRNKLASIKKLYEKIPSVASQLTYTIRQANYETDYYYPSSFNEKAIMVDVEITKELCDYIKCTPWTPTGPCTETQDMIYYNVGTTGFDTACQPACFNLLQKTEYDDDGNPQAHIPSLEWNKFDNVCGFVPSTKFWMEFPITRSQDRYEERMNDFKTGFERVDDKDKVIGYRYRYNQYYCTQFGEDYDSKKENCKEPAWLWFLDAILGKSLILTVESAVRKAVTGSSLRPIDLPDLPKVEEKYKQKWKAKLNDDFEVPDPDVLVSNVSRNIKSRKLSTEKKTTDIYDTIILNRKNIKNKKDTDMSHRRLLDAALTDEKNYKARSLKAKITIKQSFWAAAFATGGAFAIMYPDKFGEIVQSMWDWKTVAGFSDDIIFGLLKLVTTKLGNYLIKFSEKMLAKVASVVFDRAMTSIITKVFCVLSFRMVGKILIALGRVIAQISSVVGIVLLIGSFLDIAFMFWDPFGYNKQFPEGYLEDLQNQLDASLREQLGTTKPYLNFDILCGLLLTDDEQMELAINDFLYIYDYLDALEVNSEGSRIDKGDDIEFDFDADTNAMDRDKSVANNLKIYTQDELYNYEIQHNIRLKSIQTLNILGLIVSVTGFVILSFNFTEFGLFVILLGMIIFIAAYFSVGSDWIFDLNLSQWYDNLFLLLKAEDPLQSNNKINTNFILSKLLL